jgi:hypothetical protein
MTKKLMILLVLIALMTKGVVICELRIVNTPDATLSIGYEVKALDYADTTY